MAMAETKTSAARPAALKQTSLNTATAVEMIGVNKWYGEFHVLRDINLKVMKGERIVIAGPSGSGKSTMIRCINRLEEHQKGQIIVDGTELTNDLKKIDEIRRDVGMVFQHFNLFPHMSVLENVIEGPVIVQRKSRAEAVEIAMDYIAKVGLAEKRDARPDQLSGGQKQRVAIARALAMQPDALLLDEVTSALDPELVGEVLGVVRDLANQGMTMVIVTHEISFAADVSDRVVFMENGRIVAQGLPETILRRPDNERLKAFLARFHG